MDDDVVRRRVVIRGHVQGVFFRDSVRRHAEEHGVTGWVRNRPDGAVEGLFEGLPDDVDALVRFSQTGPPHARVESVETTDEEVGGDTDFRVL
jgi:acylphosphatase